MVNIGDVIGLHIADKIRTDTRRCVGDNVEESIRTNIASVLTDVRVKVDDNIEFKTNIDFRNNNAIFYFSRVSSNKIKNMFNLQLKRLEDG
jgi:hypothetical protein